MRWDLNLAVIMLLGFSLATWLFVNKEGYKHVGIYTAFALCLYFRQDAFFNIVPLFLLTILLFNPTEIRGSLIFVATLMTITTVTSVTALVQGDYNMFFLRDLTSGSSFIAASIFIFPKHKDYSLALTFTLFAMFFYSYGNPYSPFIQIAWPFACLSLIPYLGMTVIHNHFEGSIAHKYMTKALKHMAKKLKIKDKSKSTTLALAIFKLK